MDYVKELLKHFFPPQKSPKSESARKYYGTHSLGILSMLEHEIFGSTCHTVDNPFIPFASLAGRSIEWVNEERTRWNKGVIPICPEYFELPVPESYRFVFWYRLLPIDPKTLEIPFPPQITQVTDRNTGNLLQLSDFAIKEYCGQYKNHTKL